MSRTLIPILLMASSAASAADGALEFGLAGGVLFTDPLEVLGNAPTFSPRVGYWINETLAFEADLGFSVGKTQVGTPDPFPQLSLTPRINMVGRVWQDKRVSPLFVAGLGFWYKDINDNGELALPQGTGADIDLLGNAGPGAMFSLTDNLALRTDLRWMLSLGTENWENHGDAFMNWEWTAGLMLTLGGPKDTDKDGIADVDEARPECADQAEDADDFEDSDGCPDPDNDGDGILDGDDACPLDSGHPSANGCPDQDGDTVVDDQDECVEEAGKVESFGCPDNDEDLVPNYRDECPDEKANEGADPLRSNGCPTRVFYGAGRLVITEKIQFATGRADIKRASDSLLEDVANALKAAPEVTKVEVAGHTDSQGDDARNQKLSEDRAAAVVERLVKLGIEADRLTAKGYGETKPIADNETDEGRAINRRVEFTILEQGEAQRFRRVRKTEASDEAEGTDEGETKSLEKKEEEAPKTLEKKEEEAPKTLEKKEE